MDNPSPKAITLQGEPGTGKSMMACLTAVHKPVHVIDIDRKVRSAAWAQEAIAAGELTYWELNEPYDEQNLKNRLTQLVKNTKASQRPQGWAKWAEYCYTLPTNKEGKAAGTWVFDSLTFLNEHCKSNIRFEAEHSKFVFDNWNALKSIWIDTLSFLKDLAFENKKDIIFTVHERDKEKVGDRTQGVRIETDAKGNQVRTIIGTQDVKVWASIDGAFGELIGGSMDEYYWLHVVMENGKPVWKCRVHPDGRRNLRTSFKLEQSEWEPDFRKIWK